MQASGFTCDHDKLNYTVAISQKSKNDDFRRNLDSSSYSTIRITTDYSYLSKLDDDMKNYIINVVESAKVYFESILKVIPMTGNNYYPDDTSYCYDYTVPSADQTTGIQNSDLHLYIMYTYDTSASYVANAIACAITSGLYRPCFGRVNYNTYYMEDIDLTDTLEFKNYVQTSIHEITHILGFSSGLYSYWRDRTNSFGDYTSITSTITTPHTLTNVVLQTPTILSFAKSYYGCTTMTGMYLENQGGSGSAGSHWEVLISYGENMGPQVIPTNAIHSQFTLSLLYDTGWYDVDFTLAEYIGWGKGKGCDFINKGCNSTASFEEFNLDQANKCTYDRIAYGYAYASPFADYCSVTSAYSNGYCTSQGNYLPTSPKYPNTYTVGSRCFTSTYVETSPTTYTNSYSVGCHEFECSSDNTQVTIAMGDSSITCTSNSQVISTSVTSGSYTYQGSLTCPANIQTFCSQTRLCSNHCSLHGVCVQGVCHCLDAYAGTSCSVTCSNYLFGSVCLTACPTTFYHNTYNRQCIACTSSTSSYTECQTTCEAENCLYCVGGSSTQCLQCKEASNQYLQGDTTTCGLCATTSGYYITSDTFKKCKACISYCVLCSTGTTCTQCNENQYFLQASTSTCVTCDTSNGYYVTNDQYKKCASCSQSNCLICTTGTGASCTKCNQDSYFYLNAAGTCQTCDTNSGYYITSDTIKKCLACSESHCSICTAGTGTGCTKCDETSKYYLQGDTTTCDTCDTSNGYYITSDTYKKCKACGTNCMECTSSTACTLCKESSGFYVQSDGSCNSCSTTGGYYISNHKCLQCSQTNCKTCTAGTGEYCTLCDSSASKYVDSSSSLCVACDTAAGKYITTDQVYCKSCSQTNCLTCTAGTGASCTLCNAASGYYIILSSGNCGTCNTNLCSTCTGSTKYCATCDTSKHRVSSPSSGVCACDTYYFQNSEELCESCHYSCKTCTDAYTCDTCKSDTTTHRESTPSTDGLCPCQSGYKDDGSGMNCISSSCYYACSTCSTNSDQNGCSTCSSAKHRTLNTDNQCICEDSYYDNGVSELCSTCGERCQTCNDHTACTSCYSSENRELKSGATECTCMNGYYEANEGDDTCSACHYSCDTCENTYECLTCRQDSGYHRESTPDTTTKLCECLAGYNDVSGQAACKKPDDDKGFFTGAAKAAIISVAAGVPGLIIIGIVIKKFILGKAVTALKSIPKAGANLQIPNQVNTANNAYIPNQNQFNTNLPQQQPNQFNQPNYNNQNIQQFQQFQENFVPDEKDIILK